MGPAVIICAMKPETETTVKEVVIYTDGAAEPNPGPGGYGVVMLCKGRRKELSEGFAETTNNRMELLGVIAGLEALNTKSSVTVKSDSKYIVDAVNKGWVFKWQMNNWWRTKKEMAKNIDLWQRFLEVYEKHEVNMVWVKGHAGIAENERCDELAVAAAMGNDLPEDTGYVEADENSMPQPETWAKNPKSKSKRTGKKIKRKGKKITHKKAGEPCRKCQVPLKKRVTKRKKRKPGQTYYFPWHLYCPGCRAIYMVEEAKRFIEVDGGESGTGATLF